MHITDSECYLQDLKRVLTQVDSEMLSGKSILITGASGLIGSAIVDLLACANQNLGTNMKIYAAGRSREALSNRFPDGEKYGLTCVKYDATNDVDFGFPVDYIIHGASNASPDRYIEEPVDTMLANILGVHRLLNRAVLFGLKRFVYISSSEVYGKVENGKPMVEDNYGTVDLLAGRSSYPIGKQAAEAMCIAYANQYKINISIVRPGHVYGPTARETDKRVSSLFADQAARGENIVMKSAGTQLRSYCHCIDCASAVLTVLTRGINKEAYNISNRDSVITIRQMAELIAECAGVQLIMDTPSEKERAAFNPMDNSSLDSTKLEALGWRGHFDAKTGFDHTIQILREKLCEKAPV